MNNQINDRQLNEELQARLEAFAERWRQVSLRRGAARTIMIALIAVAAAAAIDYLLPLTTAQRYLLSAVCYSAIILFALFGWLLPAFMPVAPLRIAWMLEKLIPDFNEKLVSSVELANNADDRVAGHKPSHFSRELILALLQETGADLARLNPRRALPLKWRHFLPPAVALAAFLIGMAVPGFQGHQLVKRVLLPSPHDAEVGAFRLLIVAPDTQRFVEDRPLLFAVRSTDPTISEVMLEIEGARRRNLPMRKVRDGRFELELDDINTSFAYRFRSGRVATALTDMQLVRIPRISKLSVVYYFPEYTGMPPVRSTLRQGQVKALPGTRVVLSAEFSKPLSELTLQYDGKQINGTLRPDNNAGSAVFKINNEGSFTLNMVDAVTPFAQNTFEGRVEIENDAPPSITLLEPADDIMIEPGETVPLRWQATDDFGIEAIEMEIRLNRRELETIALEDKHFSMELDTGRWQLELGDRLDIRVACRDGAGQRSVTRPRGILVVHGHDATRANAFIRQGNELAALLQRAVREYQAMEPLREQLHDAATYRTASAIENLAHNRSTLAARTRRLDGSMAESLNLSRAWMPLSFYPGADRYIGLMRRYVSQERLHVLPQLPETWDSHDNWLRTRRMIELSSSMTTGLVAKAGQYQPAMLMEAMHAIVLHSAFRDDDRSREWNRRVLSHTREHARQLDESLAEIVKTVDLNQSAPPRRDGMLARLYRGRREYPPLPPEADTPPDRERRDSGINFENTRQLGLGDGQSGALHWQGYMFINEPGNYRFFCTSSDGSRLLINNRIVVRNDGRHGMRERNGRVQLERGFIRLDLLYFNHEGDGGMRLEWEPPGGQREIFPAGQLYSSLGNGPLKLAWITGEIHYRLRERAHDHGELDNIARRMEEALQAPGTELAAFAHKIDAAVIADGWPAIERAAGIIDESAAEQPLSEHARALRQVAEMYRQAADERRTDSLFAAAGRMRAVDDLGVMDETLRQVKPLLDTVERRIEEAAAATATATADDPLSTRAAADKLAEARRELARAGDRQVGDETLQRSGQMRDMRNELTRADRALSAAEEALRSADITQTREKMREAREATAAAEQELRQARDSAVAAARDAAAELARLRTDPARQLRAIAEERSDLSTELSGVEPPPAVRLSSATERIRADDKDLRSAAERWRQDALDALSGEEPDARTAAAHMAIAQRAEAARRDSAALAREISAAQDAMQVPEGVSEQHRDAAMQRAAEHLARAEQQSRASATALQETAALAENLSAAHDGRLSAREQQEALAKLEAAIQDELPPQLRAELERIESISEHRQRAAELAEALASRHTADQEKTAIALELARMEKALAETYSDRIETERKLPDSLETARTLRDPLHTPPVDPAPVMQAADAMRRDIEQTEARHALPLKQLREEQRRPAAEALGLLLSAEPPSREERRWQDAVDSLQQDTPRRQAERLRDLARRLPNEQRATSERLQTLADELTAIEQTHGDPQRHARDLQKAMHDAARKTRDIERAAEALPENLQNELKPIIQHAGEHAEKERPAEALAALDALERTLQDAVTAQRDAARIDAHEPSATPSPSMERQSPHELARQLAEAADYPERHIRPLEQARELAAENRFAEAAAQAARTPFGEYIQPQLQAAEQELRDTRRAAVEGFRDADDKAAKDAMAQAAERLAQRDTAAAADALRETATPQAEAVREKIAGLDQQREAVIPALEAAVEAAKARAPQPEELRQMAERLKNAVQQDSDRRTEEHLRTAERAARLEEAAEALRRNDLPAALAAAEKAAVKPVSAPQQQRLEQAAEALADARQAQQQARRAAAEAAREAQAARTTEAAEQLTTAAADIARGDYDRADETLQQHPAPPAAQALEDAVQKRTAAQEQLTAAAGELHEAARQAEDSLQKAADAARQAAAARDAFADNQPVRAAVELARIPEPLSPEAAPPANRFEAEARQAAAAALNEAAQALDDARATRTAAEEALMADDSDSTTMPAITEALRNGRMEEAAAAAAGDPALTGTPTEETLQAAAEATKRAEDALQKVAAAHEALAEAAKAAQHDTQQAEAHTARAAEAAAKGDLATAREALETALELAADDTRPAPPAAAARHAMEQLSQFQEATQTAQAALEQAREQAAARGERAALEQARQAAAEQDFAAAAEHAQQAGTPPAQAAAAALEQAAQHQAQTERALEEAMRTAQQAEQLAAAAAQQTEQHIPGTPAAEATRQAQQAAEQARQAADDAQHLLQAAAGQPGLEAPAAEALQQAMQQAAQGDQQAAAEQARAAGEPGQQAAQALEQAAQQAQQAQQAAQQAQQAAQQAQQAAQQQQAAAQQAQAAMNAAQQAMQQGQPQQAQQALAEAHRAARQAAAPHSPAQAAAETARQELSRMAEALEPWAQPESIPGMADTAIPAEAILAAHSADPAALAEALATTRIPHEALPYLQPVASAGQALPALVENLQHAATMAHEEARLGRETAETMQSIMQTAEAIHSDIERDHPAQAAARLPELAEQLAHLPTEHLATPYGTWPTGDPADTSEQMTRPAAAPLPPAMPVIDQARAALQQAAQQAAVPQSAQQAAQSTQQAGQNMAQAAQQMAAQTAQQTGLAQMSDAPPQGEGFGGGSQAQARQEYTPLGARDLGDPWEGADGRLHSMDAGDQARRYTPYYQRAMQTYLRKVAEERLNAERGQR